MDDVHDRAPARKAEIVIPKRNRGRQSVAYQEQVEEFCHRIEEIRATLDFEVSARAEDEARVAEHIEDLNEAVPAAFAQCWLHYVRDHAHQQCKMNSPRVRDVAASPLGVPLDLLTEQGTGSAP
jgi:hypothetical protein